MKIISIILNIILLLIVICQYNLIEFKEKSIVYFSKDSVFWHGKYHEQRKELDNFKSNLTFEKARYDSLKG
jgi:hypothetical protein